MSDIKWIKITTDMFEDEKIDFISSLPEADSIIIIWIRLLTLAGKSNSGGYIFLTEKIPYTEDMLAHKFKKPLNTVRLALQTFKNLEMIDMDEHGIFLPKWEKHQEVDKLEKIREQTRNRVSEYRSKKRLELQKCNVTVTEAVTPSNAIEQELELDIDKEKELKNNSPTTNPQSETKESIPYSEIVDYLNERCETRYRSSGSKTRETIQARWNEGFRLEDFKKVIDNKNAAWNKEPRPGEKDMRPYLRPETLFGRKFEGYLNERPRSKGGGPSGGPGGEQGGTTGTGLGQFVIE